MQRHGNESHDEHEKPEQKPSFLTARELQARGPAKAKPGDGEAAQEASEARTPKSPKKGPSR